MPVPPHPSHDAMDPDLVQLRNENDQRFYTEMQEIYERYNQLFEDDHYGFNLRSGNGQLDYNAQVQVADDLRLPTPDSWRDDDWDELAPRPRSPRHRDSGVYHVTEPTTTPFVHPAFRGIGVHRSSNETVSLSPNPREQNRLARALSDLARSRNRLSVASAESYQLPTPTSNRHSVRRLGDAGSSRTHSVVPVDDESDVGDLILQQLMASSPANHERVFPPEGRCVTPPRSVTPALSDAHTSADDSSQTLFTESGDEIVRHHRPRGGIAIDRSA